MKFSIIPRVLRGGKGMDFFLCCSRTKSWNQLVKTVRTSLKTRCQEELLDSTSCDPMEQATTGHSESVFIRGLETKTEWSSARGPFTQEEIKPDDFCGHFKLYYSMI